MIESCRLILTFDFQKYEMQFCGAIAQLVSTILIEPWHMISNNVAFWQV